MTKNQVITILMRTNSAEDKETATKALHYAKTGDYNWLVDYYGIPLFLLMNAPDVEEVIIKWWEL